MDKKGRLFLMYLLDVLIISMVFLYLYSQVQKLDIDYLHDTMIVRNLGMVMTTISFMPGNFYYTYLTEDDESMAKWMGVLSEISPDKIRYYENDTKKNPYNYKFYSNNFLSYPFNNKKVKIDKNSLNLFKLDSFHLEKSPPSKIRLKDIKCQPLFKNNEFYPLHCGEKSSFYDKEGNKVKGDPDLSYDGFEKIYKIEGERVYPSEQGLKHSTLKENEEVWKVVKMIHSGKDVDKCIPKQELSKETILLTLNNKEEDYIIVNVPSKNYSKNKKIACGLIKRLLSEREILEEVEGVNIVASKNNHITLELGSIKGRLISNYKSLIGEALKNE